VAVIVVTRLRLKDHSKLDEFFAAAVSLVEQAQSSTGNLGVDAMAEANDVWWSSSAWQDRESMRAFVTTDPHLGTMARLDDWCDEASFVDWEQSTPDLPHWQDGFRRLVAEGYSASLSQPSAANANRSFPAPVESG
jgi:quinol monooxygenase YgiN